MSCIRQYILTIFLWNSSEVYPLCTRTHIRTHLADSFVEKEMGRKMENYSDPVPDMKHNHLGGGKGQQTGGAQDRTPKDSF